MRDFDYSPFTKILKYPLLSETPTGYYKAITWKDMDVDNRLVNYMNAEDVVFISGLWEEVEVNEEMVENELSETPQDEEDVSEPSISLEKTRD